MRKLLEIPYNVFTPKIIDIIVPGCSFIKSDSYSSSNEFNTLIEKDKKSPEHADEQ